MKSHPKYWLTGAATAAVLVLAGCAPAAEEPADPAPAAGGADAEFEELVAAAQAEGTLTYFNDFPPAINDRIVAEFQAEYGIQIQYLALNSALLIERYSAEASANALSADVVSLALSDDWFEDAIDEGWAMNITDADLPALADGDYPEDFMQGDVSATVALGAFLVLYNESALDSDLVPESFEDLTNADYRDQLVLVDPSTNNAFVGFYEVLRESFGEEWFDDVLENNPKFYPAASAGAQAMMAGEGFVMTPALGAVAQALTDSGAPVATVTPPITSGPQFNLLLTDQSLAPNPNAAKLFANWMLTREGNLAATGDLIISPFDDENLPAGFVPLPPVTEEMRTNILSLLGL